MIIILLEQRLIYKRTAKHILYNHYGVTYMQECVGLPIHKLSTPILTSEQYYYCCFIFCYNIKINIHSYRYTLRERLHGYKIIIIDKNQYVNFPAV